MARYEHNGAAGRSQKSLSNDAVICSICNPLAFDVSRAVIDCKHAARIRELGIGRANVAYASRIIEAVQIIESGATHRLNPRLVGDALIAAEQNGIMAYVATLLLSGKLRNPRSLLALLQKDLLYAPGETPRAERIGKFREIQLAYELVQKGHVVEMGGPGDLVDYTDKRVIETKHVSAPNERAFLSALQKAEEQLGRNARERPQPGFERVADIYIMPPNPLCGATRKELRRAIAGLPRRRMPDDSLVAHRIKITTSAGVVEEFAPPEFR